MLSILYSCVGEFKWQLSRFRSPTVTILFIPTVDTCPRRSSRCDFVEGGLCHESPRWVSLLVAEIFYPNAVFPTSSPERRRAPVPPQPQTAYYPQLHHQAALLQPPPSVGDFHDFQQYLHRRVGADQQSQKRSQQHHPPQQQAPRPQQQRLQQIKRRSDAAGPRASATSSPRTPKEKCDGHDSVGCYIVRMYYDWFLVNGSCKCWKPSGKHVFTGRR